MEETNFMFNVIISIIFGILLLTGLIWFGAYKYRQLNIENFEKTINELSDEQKCMHICGFQFTSYFDRYKFCLEKCDRISEREAKCNT